MKLEIIKIKDEKTIIESLSFILEDFKLSKLETLVILNNLSNYILYNLENKE